MRKIILSISLFFFTVASFSQDVKQNGIIYINHPYIEMVKKQTNAYIMHDNDGMKEMYADTAKYWAAGMEKPMSLPDAVKMWSNDFNYFDSIKVTPVGYPDYLEYVKDNDKIVQSWWHWSGKSKKSGKVVTVDYVQFDNFNSAGKVGFEYAYGNFAALMQEEQ